MSLKIKVRFFFFLPLEVDEEAGIVVKRRHQTLFHQQSGYCPSGVSWTQSGQTGSYMKSVCADINTELPEDIFLESLKKKHRHVKGKTPGGGQGPPPLPSKYFPIKSINLASNCCGFVKVHIFTENLDYLRKIRFFSRKIYFL